MVDTSKESFAETLTVTKELVTNTLTHFLTLDRTTISSFAIVTVLVACCAGMPSVNAGTDSNAVSPPIRATYVHPWALPYANGTVSALVIAPRYTLLDLMELSRSIDISPDVVSVWSTYALGYDGTETGTPNEGCSTKEVLEQLRARLNKKYDVIIAGNIDFGILPKDIIDALTLCIQHGAGLVLAHHQEGGSPEFDEFLKSLHPLDANLPITRGIGYTMLPEWSAGIDFVSASTLGDGRVVQLNYPVSKTDAYGALRPRSHFLLPVLLNPMDAEPVYFESYIALISRAILWAAQREPETFIDRIEFQEPPRPKEDEIPPGLPAEYITSAIDASRHYPCFRYVIHLSAPAPKSYQVRLRIRKPGGDVERVLVAETPWYKGETAYALQVVAEPGDQLLDIWLMNDKKVTDWYTEPVTRQSWPRITSMFVSKRFLLPHDSVAVSMRVEPNPLHPKPTAIWVRAIELPATPRIVAEAFASMPVEGGSATVRIDLPDVVSDCVKFEVLAAEANDATVAFSNLNISAYAHTYLPVYRAWNRHRLSMVASIEGSAEYNLRTVFNILKASGFDAAYTQPSPEPGFFLASSGLAPLPYLLVHHTAHGDADQNHSVTPSAETLVSSLVVDATQQWNAGPARLVLKPESEQTQSNANPADKISDRSIATSFSERDNSLHLLETCRDQIKSAIPAASVGLDGSALSTTAFAAADEAATKLDFLVMSWNPSSISIAQLRQTADLWNGAKSKTSTLALAVKPTFKSASWATWLAWFALFHGTTDIIIEDVYGSNIQEGPTLALLPNLALESGTKSLMKTASRLQSGLDALLLQATKEPSKIALYSSLASQCSTERSETYPVSHRQAQAIVAEALTQLGFTYDYVSGERLDSDVLSGYSLVLLPTVTDLSDQEVDALRCYVDGGGALIADILPGAYDDKGAQPEVPRLADVFGVRVLERQSLTYRENITANLRLSDSNSLSRTLTHVTVDESVASQSDSPDVQPIWLPRMQGERMTTLLLNHTLTAQPKGEMLFDENDLEPLRSLLHAVLFHQDLHPVLDVTCDNKAFFRGERFRFRFDDANLYGVLQSPNVTNTKMKIDLNVPTDGVLYNVLADDGGRPVKKCSVTLSNGESALFSQLPYEVVGLDVVCAKTVLVGRRLDYQIRIKTREGLPGDHIVHIELRRADGYVLRHYSKDIVCKKGAGADYIPLALNEQQGMYTLVARDVLTGATVETPIVIIGGMPVESHSPNTPLKLKLVK